MGNLSVVVGRFQVPYLTKGHLAVLDKARARSTYGRALVIIKTHPKLSSVDYPLDFATVDQMIREAFPQATCVPLEAQYDKSVWDSKVKAIIAAHKPFGYRTEIITGEDFRHVAGLTEEYFNIVEVPAVSPEVEGTPATSSECRDSVKFPLNIDGRKGAIWATTNSYPRIDHTVDVLVHHRGRYLFGRKNSMPGKICMVGGYVDPCDLDIRDTACRELMEETKINAPKKSFSIVWQGRNYDWRDTTGYDSWTTLVVAEIDDARYAQAVPSDDLDELVWIYEEELAGLLGGKTLLENHQALLKHYLGWKELKETK